MEKFKNWDIYIEEYGKKLIDYMPNLMGAIILLIIGWWAIKFINRIIRKIFIKKDIDITLRSFLLDVINWVLRVMLFITVISQLGVQTSSFVAFIGAAGLAIGLALQGSLANFAGGVLIMLFKPYRVGHLIAAQGVEGTVKEISIFTTKLTTFGNQLIIIPNGKLSNDNIINYSEESVRRENLIFGISYDGSIKDARNILLQLATEQPQILKTEDKLPMVVVVELAVNSVNLSLRYWTTVEDFFEVRFYTIEEATKRLEAAGIVFPFPQQVSYNYNMEENPEGKV